LPHTSVIHMQLVADRQHHHLTRIESDPVPDGHAPGAGIIDRQSVKTMEQGDPRVRSHKHVNRRQRHILIEMLRLLPAVVVIYAS
jgi:hypothetical protein